MYLPPAFADKDLLQARAIMREHPFASLVSNDNEGFPFVWHLPLHLVGQPEPWCLLGHCAKGNPHGRFLRERPQSLATFLGPHAYLSPAVYPDLAREPTRNYLDAPTECKLKLNQHRPETHEATCKGYLQGSMPMRRLWRSGWTSLTTKEA